MQNVNAFLDEHPEEIVILDFQKVYDCTKNDHEQLIDIIETSLGSKLLSKNHTYGNLSIGQFPMSFFCTSTYNKKESYFIWPFF